MTIIIVRSRKNKGFYEYFIGTANSARISDDRSNAVEGTAKGVQTIASSRQEIHKMAQTSFDTARNGEQSIQEAKIQMESIYDSSKQTSNLFTKLSESSLQIQNITKVITDITDQKNLLSLNVAIEAARAGEHGKGFAVVADEVRNLTEQSKHSANSIVALTTHISEETKYVETAVNNGLTRVERGVDAIETAGLSFDAIVNSIEEMVVQIEQVSSVTEEIAAATEEVAASVDELSGNIAQPSANTEGNFPAN